MIKSIAIIKPSVETIKLSIAITVKSIAIIK